MLYFFLSYARGDEDELIERFYRDLCTEVRLLAGAPSGNAVGFVDRTIQVGERWPGRLSDALGQCGCFIALMTPRYFQSEACGKEWQLFAQRARTYEAQANVDSSLLKPLMWVPMPQAKIHPVAEHYQHFSAPLGDTYQRLGVRQLMRLQRYRDDYHTFVFELARQIVDSVDRHQVPPRHRGSSFDQVHSAFHTSLTTALANHNSSQPATEPMLVHFIVAAGTREAMSAIRKNLGGYGARPLDWAPYRPSLPVPLVDFAREVATSHGWTYAPVADAADLARRAELASRHNQIVVLLVDAWSARLGEVNLVLRDHDARAGGAPAVTAVLIPSSRQDTETRQNWQELSAACRAMFERLATDDELYRSLIADHRGFESDLPDVLEVARNRIYNSGQVKRPPAGGVSTAPPQIDGPWIRDVEEDPP